MKKILQLLPRILMIGAFILMAGLVMSMAYIMFAPDSWWKPFYLNYQEPIAEEEATDESSAEASAESETISQEPQTAHAASGEGSEGEVPTASLEIRPGQGIMVDTGTKIVNLIDPSGRKYLRVGIVLEFAPTDLRYYTMEIEEKTAFITTFNEEVNARLPIMNDVIITLLANQSFESVYTAEGKENLRKSLMDTINTQLPEYRVIFVYFTEFVVQ